MKTEGRQPNRESRLHASPLELRLYVAALLAVIYTIAWRAVGGHVQTMPASTQPEPEVVPAQRESPRFVWIDSLPVTMQPPIALPAGWQRASQPPTSQPARMVRAPSRQVPRVRTRSS